MDARTIINDVLLVVMLLFFAGLILTTGISLGYFLFKGENMIIEKQVPVIVERNNTLIQLINITYASTISTTTTTSSTTSSTIKRLSTASMYCLVNPFESATFYGSFFINQSVDTNFLAVDGSNKRGKSYTWVLQLVSPAEARYYSNNLNEEDIEGVYYRFNNDTLVRYGQIIWRCGG